MSEHELPVDLDAEEATLGSILLDRDAIILVAPWLRPDDFFLQRHVDTYKAMLACFARREPPDLRLVIDELGRQGTLDRVGGLPFLTDLIVKVPTAYHIEWYARIVQSMGIRRRGIRAGGAISALGWDLSLSPQEFHSKAIKILDGIAPSATGGEGFKRASAVVDEIDEHVERGEDEGILLGLAEVDDALGGLYPGNLTLLGGIPGSGKTSLGTQVAWECARAGRPAGIISLEMTREEVVMRMISYQTGIPTHALRSNRLTDAQETASIRAKMVIADTPIYVDDASGVGPEDIRTRALRLQQEVGQLSILVIDYLGLVAMDQKRQTVSQAMNAAAMHFKNLSKELRCPTILCTQLNRDIFHRSDKTPQLSDLREAGEAPADQVLCVMRPEQFEPGDQPGEALVYLLKNRHGPTLFQPRPCRFDGARYRFAPLAPPARQLVGY